MRGSRYLLEHLKYLRSAVSCSVIKSDCTLPCVEIHIETGGQYIYTLVLSYLFA